MIMHIKLKTTSTIYDLSINVLFRYPHTRTCMKMENAGDWMYTEYY